MVTEFNGKRVIYATDTSTLEHAPEGLYDLFLIESNHDELKIKLAKGVKGYDPKINAQRHLSKQASREFYFLRRVGVESEYVELHKSARFY